MLPVFICLVPSTHSVSSNEERIRKMQRGFKHSNKCRTKQWEILVGERKKSFITFREHILYLFCNFMTKSVAWMLAESSFFSMAVIHFTFECSMKSFNSIDGQLHWFTGVSIFIEKQRKTFIKEKRSILSFGLSSFSEAKNNTI